MTVFSNSGAGRATLAALLVLVAVPGIASAAIVHTSVTEPASPFRAIDDQTGTLGLPTTVTVSGTTDSTAPGVDTVDLVCTFDGASSASLATAVVLDGAGAFSASVSLADLSIEGPCVIRALPAGAGNLSWPRFGGPTALVGEWRTTLIVGGPNAGALATYAFEQVELRGANELSATGDAGITDAHAMGVSFERANSPVASAFRLQQRREFGAAPTSSVLVDGQSGYTTAAAIARLNDQAPGLPGLTAAPSLTADGPRLLEVSDVVRCDDETACAAFVPTGVRLERSYALAAEGRRQLISDRYLSTDGLAHDLDIAYEMDGPTSEYGFALAGSAVFERYSGTIQSFAAGPVSMIGKETDDEPAESPEAFAAGLTWNAPPELRFAGQGGGEYEALYVRQVPADGAVTLNMALTVGWGVLPIRDLVLEHENQLTDPVVAITSPAPGATTLGDRIGVSGIASGPRALGLLSRPSVVVGGVTAVVAPDGTWTADVPLAVGANTLTVTATNGANRSATATLQVTRSALAGPPAPATAGTTPAAVGAVRLTESVVGKAKRTRRLVTFTFYGRLQRPDTVAALSACRGWVLLRARRGSTLVSSAWTPLRSDCSYRRTITFKRGTAGLAGIRVTARFTGNERVLPISATGINVQAR